MVAYAFGNSDSAAVANRKPLADQAVDEYLPGRRSVQQRVAGHDVLVRGKRRIRRRLDNDPPAREALAEIVVAVADQPKRDPRGQKRTEALAR